MEIFFLNETGCEHAQLLTDTSIMAASDVEIAGEALNNLKINGDSPALETNATATSVQEQWGFPSAELYRIALAFYKGIGMFCIFFCMMMI